MRRLALLGMLILLALPRVARADSSARLVYVRAADAATCPDDAALRRAVAARVGYDPFFAWARSTVVVEVRRDGTRFASRVQVIDENGVAHGERDLTSGRDSCAELFDATALAISIALDAAARTEPSQAVPVERSVAPAAPVDAPAAPAPPVAETAPADAPAMAATAPSSSISVGVDLLGSAGTAPSPSAGAAVFVAWRVGAASLALEGRADAPAGETTSDHVRAASWLYAASAVPCVHLGPAMGCAVGSLGQFVASGSGNSQPASGSALYAAAGARVGGEWALSQSWSLRAHADGLVDLDRPVFRIDGTDAWRAPLVAVTLALGVAARIP